MLTLSSISMAEDNLELTRGRTLVHERRCVMRKGERRRARVLEERGVHRPLTHLRAIVMVPTAKLVRVKSLTPTLTRHHRAVTHRNTVLQQRRTRGNQVAATTHHGAHAFTLVRRHR